MVGEIVLGILLPKTPQQTELENGQGVSMRGQLSLSGQIQPMQMENI